MRKTKQHFQENNAHPHDAKGQAKLLEQLAESVEILKDSNRETLSGAKTLEDGDPQFQNLDPDGAGRDVTLPPEAEGLKFVIGNRASAANDLTVKDDSGSTLVTVNQDDVAIAYSDGDGWMAFAAAGGVT